MQEKLDNIKDIIDTYPAVEAAPVLAEFAKELDKAGLCFGPLREGVENLGGVFWNATSCNLIGIKTEGNRLSEELQDYNVESTFTTTSGQGVQLGSIVAKRTMTRKIGRFIFTNYFGIVVLPK